jgi:hypothetical protein
MVDGTQHCVTETSKKEGLEMCRMSGEHDVIFFMEPIVEVDLAHLRADLSRGYVFLHIPRH